MKTLALLLAALALPACDAAGTMGEPGPAPRPRTTVLTGDLDLDIRSQAHVALTVSGFHVTAALTLSKGFGVVTAPLAGEGHVERFAEADLTLYTAQLDAPADPSGPCGAQPVSLALSLRRRGTDAHVGGSLTAYCGAATWHGTPARLLRLAGDLPLPP
jgi:hypothetical protein